MQKIQPEASSKMVKKYYLFPFCETINPDNHTSLLIIHFGAFNILVTSCKKF